MKINKLELQQALAIVKPGLASKEVLEQTTSFAFINGRVITYNDELSISHPVKGIDFTGVVKAEELYGLLQRLKKEEIEIELVESELRITCGRVKAGLKLATEIILPIESEIGVIKKWLDIPDPEEFAKHLFFAMNTCSTDMSQLKLTCVNVTEEGMVQASDSFRLIQCKGKPMPVPTFLIPASLVNEVLKIDPKQIKLKGPWIHFKNDEGTILSTRRVDDSYVSQEQIDRILENKGSAVLVFPKVIDSMIDRVGQFAKRDFSFDETIDVAIKNGKITLSAEALQTKSWIKESAAIESEQSLNFSMTPSLFTGILKETRQCALSKDMKKATFTSKAGSWKYAIMLRGEQ